MEQNYCKLCMIVTYHEHNMYTLHSVTFDLYLGHRVRSEFKWAISISQELLIWARWYLVYRQVTLSVLHPHQFYLSVLHSRRDNRQSMKSVRNFVPHTVLWLRKDNPWPSAANSTGLCRLPCLTPLSFCFNNTFVHASWEKTRLFQQT